MTFKLSEHISYLGVALALHKLAVAGVSQQLHFPLAANPSQGRPSFRLLERLDKSRHRPAGKEPSHGLNLKRRSQINFRLCTYTISDLLMTNDDANYQHASSFPTKQQVSLFVFVRKKSHKCYLSTRVKHREPS